MLTGLLISIITPFYCGNSYMAGFYQMVEKAAKEFLAQGQERSVEVIIVNDSPWERVELPENESHSFRLIVIDNKKNSGIHQSRVNGLEKAAGEYVLFLDQDDEISGDCLCTQIKAARSADLVLGNGIFELPDHQKAAIYGNHFSLKFASRAKPNVMIRDFIVSPGQCLIKKNSIPMEWRRCVMKKNGADDYLLWLLMFNNKMSVSVNDAFVYTHKYTGGNISADLEVMFQSSLELLELLKRNPNYQYQTYRKLERTIHYKHDIHLSRKRYFTESLKNLDIFLYNVYYRLVWRGCLLGKGRYT